MTKKIFSFAIAIIILINLPNLAENKPIYNKFVTYKHYMTISGYGPKNSYIIINNAELATDITGKYKAHLPLNLGKNIFYFYTPKRKVIRTIKVVRIENFMDVPKGYWAFNNINNMASLGIIEGLPDGTFNPRKHIEQEVYYSWLCMTMGLKPKEPKKDISSLMPKERWRSPYINAVKASGALPDSTFKDFDPSAVISRKEAISQIIGIFKKEIILKKKTKEDLPFPKEDKTYRLINIGFSRGMIKGTGKARVALELSRPINYAELATLIARLPHVLKKKNSFFNWKYGFGKKQVTPIYFAPVIKKVQALPDKIESNNKDVSTVLAMVDDIEGIEDIKEVRIDMSEIGKGSALKMLDNGEWGDYKAGDNIYSIQLNVSRKIIPGIKEFFVVVRDFKGWQKRAVVKVNVKKPLNALPEITRLEVMPTKVKADGKTKFSIKTLVKDANGYDDIKSVVADLGDINRSFRKKFKKVSEGNYILSETVPTEILTGKKIFPVYITDGAGEYIRKDAVLNVVRK